MITLPNDRLNAVTAVNSVRKVIDLRKMGMENITFDAVWLQTYGNVVDKSGMPTWRYFYRFMRDFEDEL